MESKSYACVKCGRECFFWLHGNKEATEQLCSQCYSEAHTQKEPFNFEHPEPISHDAFGSMNEVPDDVQKTAPKHVPSLTDLIRDEARKRAMRNECNGLYKRSADADVPACAICAQHLDGSRSLKTATGQVICEPCHYRLYHEEPCKKTNATTHGMKHTRIYNVWCAMKQRCLYKNHKHYENYGGRGITICEEWLDFENFYRDMGDVAKGMSLDRIDNDKGYYKDNCRWATRKEQNNNKKNTIYVVYRGEVISTGYLATLLGVNSDTLLRRVRQCWPEERWGETARKKTYKEVSE